MTLFGYGKLIIKHYLILCVSILFFVFCASIYLFIQKPQYSATVQLTAINNVGNLSSYASKIKSGAYNKVAKNLSTISTSNSTSENIQSNRIQVNTAPGNQNFSIAYKSPNATVSVIAADAISSAFEEHVSNQFPGSVVTKNTEARNNVKTIKSKGVIVYGIAILLGVIVAIGIIFWRSYYSGVVTDDESVQAAFNLDFLGPLSNDTERSKTEHEESK